MRLVVRGFWLLMVFVVRVVVASSRYAWCRVQRAMKAQDMIQLRDALTGEKLGMTKAQHKRLMLALGSKDERQMFKALKEARARRLQANQ